MHSHFTMTFPSRHFTSLRLIYHFPIPLPEIAWLLWADDVYKIIRNANSTRQTNQPVKQPIRNNYITKKPTKKGKNVNSEDGK
jgi:hypothetical protein